MKSIPTMYRGTKFRSRLESEVAFLLDALGLEWEYEPVSFLLSSGDHYWPDFYVPVIRLWVEARGYDSEKGNRQIEGFTRHVRQEKPAPDYLVLRPENCTLYEVADSFSEAGRAVLGCCRDCERWYFFGEDGAYRCRHCEAWDGGSHLMDLHDLEIREGRVYLVDALGIAVTAAEFAAAIRRPEAA